MSITQANPFPSFGIVDRPDVAPHYDVMSRTSSIGACAITTWCKCALLIAIVLLCGNPAPGGRIPEINVFGLEFSPDGRQLAAALGVTDYDIDDLYFEVRIWNVSDWSVAASWREPNAFCVGYSPDGRYLAVGTMMGGGIAIRDLTHQSEIVRLRTPEVPLAPKPKDDPGAIVAEGPTNDKWVFHVRFSPNGRYLAAGLGDTVAVWEVGQIANPQEVGRTPVTKEWFQTFAFTDDGKSLVYTTDARSVQVVDLPSFALQRQTKPSPTEESTFPETFDRAGHQLLTTTERFVQTWDVESNRALPTVPTSGRAIGFAYSQGSTFSHDGRRFAFVTAKRDESPEQFVRVFDVNPPKELQRLPFSSPSLIRIMALSPDGSMVAAGGAGAEEWEDACPIKVWNIDSGNVVAELYYDQSPGDEPWAASLTWVFVVVGIGLVALLSLLTIWLRRRATQRRQAPQ